MNKESLIELVGDNKKLAQLIDVVFSYGYENVTIDEVSSRLSWDFEFSSDLGSDLGILAEEDEVDESYSDFFSYNFCFFEENFDQFIMEYGPTNLKLSDGRILFITNKWAEEGMEEWDGDVTIHLLDWGKLNLGLIIKCRGYLKLN